MGFWDARVLPFLVEKACRSGTILEERRRIVPRASGRVLELGVGSGLNLAFYDPAHAKEIVAIDPSAPLLAKARPRAREAKVKVELVEASAESLPFDAASFDDAVVTYSLCSVADPLKALGEVRRVLKPGAHLYFVEHGIAPDERWRRWQRRLTPYWRHISGNCHLDRDLPAELAAAGFTVDEMHASYTDGPKWMTFTYEGVASCG